MRECWFNGTLNLRKGDIVKISRVIPSGEPIRVTIIENETTGENRESSDNRTLMTVMPMTLKEPIIGRVVSIKVGSNNVTTFAIDEGLIVEHVFVRAGQKQIGQTALVDILTNGLDSYVKIMDAYISDQTISLLYNVPTGIDILILTQKVSDMNLLAKAIGGIKNKSTIKTSSVFHDRFILTKGEGWTLGHSLKDFGSKDSYLSKLVSTVDAEAAFDAIWTQAVTLIRS